MEKKTIAKFISLLFFIIVFLYSSLTLSKWSIENNIAKRQNENLIKEIINVDTINSPDLKHTNIDFEKLKQMNSDVVAWIRINNTNINYPVLQNKDNDYYLSHSLTKEDSVTGSIFLDYENNNSFTDKNTIVYGHNMKSGLMFADLHKFNNGKLGNDIIIDVYTPSQTLRYKVFSVYISDVQKLGINYFGGFTYKEFLEYIKSKSNIDFQANINENNNILTLSTCNTNSNNSRLLVHAILQDYSN
ncbi:MAG: class B sortase [Clostridia bacterium]|nr:class B sortase [Clostridia bacterium]